MDPDFGDLRALRARMVVWAKALTRGGSNAEDLVQSALLKMLAGRHLAPKTLREVDPWARVVLLNEFRNDRRAQGRQPIMADLNEFLTAPDNPETSAYCRQVFREVLRLDPSLLFDPDTTGNRWMADVTKTVAQRRRRHRARKAVAEMVA